MDINVWFPESVYFGALAYSVILMTASLLFYHMTKTNSLEMRPRTSATFAVLLIIISVLFAIMGVSSYYVRLQELQKQKQNLSDLNKTFLEKEIAIFWFYLVLGTVYMLIEIGICWYIVRGV